MGREGTILMRESRDFSVGRVLFVAGCDLDMAGRMLAYEYRADQNARQLRMERDLNIDPEVARHIRSTSSAQPAV
jgi:hypothetical protein